MEHFPYGIKKEDLVAALLRRFGFETYYSRGSRGAGDLVASAGRRRLLVQVKSTRKKVMDARNALRHALGAFKRQHQTRLSRAANLLGAVPVLAFSSGSYVWMFDPREDRFDVLHHGWLPRRAARRQ